MRRYAIQGRDDYRKYNQLAGSLRQLAHRIANLDPSDPFRAKQEDLILEKLFSMGLLGTGGGGRGKLSDVEHKLTVSAFARRRLPVVMTRLRMADHVQSAVTLVEQGVSTLDSGHDFFRGHLPRLGANKHIARKSWNRRHHRPSVPGLEEYGRLRHMGRLLQD